MKKIVLIVICSLMPGCFIINARLAQQQSVTDSVSGWVKVYRLKGAKEVEKIDNRVFSIAQLSVCDSLINWMQASYVPRAGIGDIRKILFPETGQNDACNTALPQGYGAPVYTWDVTYNSERKAELKEPSETLWDISANAVPGVPVPDLCTAEKYYFTLPSFKDGTEGKQEQELSRVESLKAYITFLIRNRETGNTTDYVLLCRENKSPFIKLTKGEYLQLLETAIPNSYQEEKKKIYDENKDNQKSIDYLMGFLEEKFNRRMTYLKINQEKYRDRLSETAETFAAQPDIMLENYQDVFEGNGGLPLKYTVYTIDPAMVELCKEDKPQWILSSWKWNPKNPEEIFMNESIINNFNFDYVYNFFFAPEKVKDQLYEPRNSPASK